MHKFKNTCKITQYCLNSKPKETSIKLQWHKKIRISPTGKLLIICSVVMAQLFFCLLALIQVIPLGWFGCSVLGYVLGRLIYFVLLQLHTQPIYNPITPPQNITPQPKHLAKPTVKESVSPEQKLLDDFFKLQFQVGDLLPATANAKFQDIHALIIVLVQKFKRTQDFNMQNEILKIQSVIKNYLAPTIKNYQELPVFFLDRKIDNRGGPTCLNN